MSIERLIYTLHDTVDDKYWTGTFPDWSEFRLCKLWHREGDAKRMFKRSVESFGHQLTNVQDRLSRYPNNRAILEEAAERHSRSLSPNHGIRILKLMVTPA